MKTIQLPVLFDGRGETKGFKFKQLKKSLYGYIYEVKSAKNPHYEVFRKKTFAVCLDFKNRVYSDTEIKVGYPKKNAFGKTAWTAMSLERANKILIQINTDGKRKEKALST